MASVDNGDNKYQAQDLSSDGNIYFIVTGFGAFRGVPNNPTTVLTDKLIPYIIESTFYDGDEAKLKEGRNTFRHLLSCILSCHAIETSVEAVRSKLDTIHEDLMATDLKRNMGTSDGSTVIFIHLGVNDGGEKFHLEQFAYNDASFRCPDERGYQPNGTKIVPDLPMGDPLETQMDVKNLLSTLCSSSDDGLEKTGKNGFSHHGGKEQEVLDLNSLGDDQEVAISTDPGRFVCNYTYCYSMNKFSCHKRDENNNNNGSSICPSESSNSRLTFKSLFVHVPPFHKIPEERQLYFVAKLMDVIYRQEISS